MTGAVESLPNDLAKLKAIIAQQQAQIAEQQGQIAWMSEQLGLLRAKRFGASSEQADSAQLNLFNEAEAEAEAETAPPTEEPDGEVQERAGATTARRRGHRKALPEELPRVIIEHDLPEAEKVCPNEGCGAPLKRIGEETSEQLDIIPAQVRVIRHVRPTYACPCCQEGVTARRPRRNRSPRATPRPGCSPSW